MAIHTPTWSIAIALAILAPVTLADKPIGYNPNPVDQMPREPSRDTSNDDPLGGSPGGGDGGGWPCPLPDVFTGPYYPGPYYPGPYYPGGPYFPPDYYGPIVLPPLHVPAETFYGPGRARELADMGGAQSAVPPLPPADARELADTTRPDPNARTMGIYRTFVQSGDRAFQSQKYPEAYRTYRKAAQVASNQAEAHFRQAFALMAMGSYELAMKAARRGFVLDPAWADSGFQIADLYGGNAVAKAAHIDGLAQAAIDAPDDAQVLFLVGMVLYFDGQTERAKPFFERAGRLNGELRVLSAGFARGAQAEL